MTTKELIAELSDHSECTHEATVVVYLPSGEAQLLPVTVQVIWAPEADDGQMVGRPRMLVEVTDG